MNCYQKLVAASSGTYYKIVKCKTLRNLQAAAESCVCGNRT